MDGRPIWGPEGCLRCGFCVGACPKGALRLGMSGIVLDERCCISCMRCAISCPTGAFGGDPHGPRP